ncbi:UNVERIFIED_CONTAM: hypothetical protein Sradi_1222400 [Sesamum radiatum]|uniref:Uncharacterized protein n=1 Tax=Sesamum radiatum TaxID=300843 RepID=A0AAW2ULB9_SESRA
MISTKFLYVPFTTLVPPPLCHPLEARPSSDCNEYFVSHTVVLCQLQWGLGVHMRHTVDAESELAIGGRPSVDKLDGASDVDLPVLVGALWVGTCSTGCEVPPEGAELADGPCNALGVLGRWWWELR